MFFNFFHPIRWKKRKRPIGRKRWSLSDIFFETKNVDMMRWKMRKCTYEKWYISTDDFFCSYHMFLNHMHICFLHDLFTIMQTDVLNSYDQMFCVHMMTCIFVTDSIIFILLDDNISCRSMFFSCRHMFFCSYDDMFFPHFFIWSHVSFSCFIIFFSYKHMFLIHMVIRFFFFFVRAHVLGFIWPYNLSVHMTICF